MGSYVMTHADDLCIYSKDAESHVKHVAEVFKRLDENGFCLDRTKMHLAKRRVNWLGFEISTEGIGISGDRASGIRELKPPKTLKELRSVLGLLSFYRNIIPGFAKIAAPMTNILGGKEPRFYWNKLTHAAFETLKDSLCSAPVLSNGDFDRPMELHTDASVEGMAAVLVQKNEEGKYQLIDCASRTTKNPEKSYYSGKLETACIIWAVRKFRHYLTSLPKITIVTDSTAATFLHTKSEITPLLQRWMAHLEGLNYEIRYVKGEDNIADYLSRKDPKPHTEEDVGTEEDSSQFVAATTEKSDRGLRRSTRKRIIAPWARKDLEEERETTEEITEAPTTRGGGRQRPRLPRPFTG